MHSWTQKLRELPKGNLSLQSSSREIFQSFYTATWVHNVSSGGLELLFANQRRYTIKLPDVGKNDEAVDMDFLIQHLCENLLKDRRQDMFVLNRTM